MNQRTHVLISVFDYAAAGVFVPAAEASNAWPSYTVCGDDFPSSIVSTDVVPCFFAQIMYDYIHDVLTTLNYDICDA